jgi:hypothetical protein
MGRISGANRRGDQRVEWEPGVTTEEEPAAVTTAEQPLREARQGGCAIAKRVDGHHVLDPGPFDPQAEEDPILAPRAGG